MAQKQFQSFTTYFSGRINKPVNKVGIALPNQNSNKSPTHKYKAIWDTGATNCVITKKVVQDLGLKPFSKRKVISVHGEQTANVYYVDIFPPSKVCIQRIIAFETSSLAGEVEMLIGMDVIALGDFSITHAKGKSIMSYRTPSIKDIDYVAESRKITNKSLKHGSKSRKTIKANRKKEKKNKKARKK